MMVYLKHILFILLAISLMILNLNCSRKVTQTKASTQNIEYLIEKGNQYWEQRIDSNALIKTEHFINLAYEQQKNNFSLAILLSKIIFTKAYFSKNENLDSLFLRSSNICMNAVLIHDDFSPILKQSKGDSVFKLLSAIAEAPRSVIPGLYWWGVNRTMYLQNRPVLERIKERELLEVIMHRVLSLEPDFYFGGPYRFFGSLYTRIPGIELSQSKSYFDQAIVTNPQYLGNHVQLAQYYYQKSGDREKFNETLKMVLNVNLTDYPEIMADNFYYQKKAEILLENESLLFE